MHPKVKAIFDEHAAPKHCAREHVMAATKPLAAFVARFQRQTMELRALVLEAETEPDLPDALRGKIDMLHSKLARRDRIGADLLKATRDANTIQVETDELFNNAKSDLEEWYSGQSRRDGVGLKVK
jgi:hypothetical protein